MGQRTAKCLLLLPIALALLVSSRPAPAQRDCCQGNWWLKWDNDQRKMYFYGYAVGYTNGFLHGCERGSRRAPTTGKDLQLPFDRCMEGQRDFSRGADYFVGEVTSFYQSHPEVRDIYPYEVLDLLGRGLTVQQIRSYPFMRHGASPSKP